MERGVGEIVAHGQKNVSEFWEVVGGLQLVVVQDGESAGHGGGFGGGTDLGAVPGSGGDGVDIKVLGGDTHHGVHFVAGTAFGVDGSVETSHLYPVALCGF